jgi:malate/lactate dehydrogenase
VEDVESLVLGGHGDLMVPMPRFTTVKGIPIAEFISKERIDALVERTRRGGEEVVKFLKTGSAHYAPAAAIYQMIKAIIFDDKSGRYQLLGPKFLMRILAGRWDFRFFGRIAQSISGRNN